MLEFPEYDEGSFRPDANIGHLCDNLNNTVGKGIWFDTFQIQNTKWLWLVNNVIAVLNSDNIHFGCFGQYANYVARILNSVKGINFYVLYNKRRLHCSNYLEKCISSTQCSISFKSHTKNYFVLISGEEKVVIMFQSRFLHGKLPSKLTFSYAVLNKIRFSYVTYGNLYINKRVIYVTNEVVISQHICAFEQCTIDLNIPKQLANCKLFMKSCKRIPSEKVISVHCTAEKISSLTWRPSLSLCIKKGTSYFEVTLR